MILTLHPKKGIIENYAVVLYVYIGNDSTDDDSSGIGALTYYIPVKSR